VSLCKVGGEKEGMSDLIHIVAFTLKRETGT